MIRSDRDFAQGCSARSVPMGVTTKKATPKNRPAPRPKNARAVFDARKADILRELDRIRAEVAAYEPSREVETWGAAGDLGGIQQGLDELHMVGREYKREAAR